MDNEIHLIINKHFNEPPKEIKRMETGICNEVYLVKLKKKSVIVRMNQFDIFFKGSSLHIPMFRAKGIKVPKILFEDYSKQTIPYAYQILTFIEGEDFGQVIKDLSPKQLDDIAKEVSTILLKLVDLPTSGKFG